MNTILLILASILPVLVLLWYFEKQDKGKKEPPALKWKVFRWGIVITLIAAFIEINLDQGLQLLFADPIIYIFFSSFITAALIEEAAKFWVVKRFAYKSKHFNEVMDGITYTILASLGFAAFENLLYVLQGGLGIAIIRAFLSVPAHAMFSGIMGYYIGKSKFSNYGLGQNRLLWKGFLIAVFYHGLYNFLLLTSTALMFLVFPLLIIMGIHLHHLIRQARFTDHVDKTKPRRLTFWRLLRIFSGIVFIGLGFASIAGSIILYVQPELAPDAAFQTQDIIYSSIFALILFFISYLLLQRKK